MQINRTYNSEAVDAILKDPSVFSHIIDDTSPCHSKFSSFDLMEDKRNVALLVSDEGKHVGCFICVQCSPTSYEGHINLTSLCRGRKALEALNLGAKWLFSRTDAFRIIGLTPELNKPALHIARLAGYQFQTLRERAFKKQGKHQNAIQSELTLYQWLSRQDVYEKNRTGLDTWQLQNLLFYKELIDSGNIAKAKFLLSELSPQSYSKRISINDYPFITIEAKRFHIDQIF